MFRRCLRNVWVSNRDSCPVPYRNVDPRGWWEHIYIYIYMWRLRLGAMWLFGGFEPLAGLSELQSSRTDDSMNRMLGRTGRSGIPSSGAPKSKCLLIEVSIKMTCPAS